jgi:hypothetical protein
MNQNRLFLLLSLSPEDHKWHENWDDDWDWLYDNGLIDMEEDEIPYLTELGTQCIQFAVKKADELV